MDHCKLQLNDVTVKLAANINLYCCDIVRGMLNIVTSSYQYCLTIPKATVATRHCILDVDQENSL